MPGGGQVQLFLHHPGCTRATLPLGIDLDDPAHVPGQVHHDRLPDRLAGQAGPGTPGQHRDAELPAVATTAATSAASRGKTTPIGSIAYMLASRENRCLV